MNNIIERFVVALELIGTSLAQIANGDMEGAEAAEVLGVAAADEAEAKPKRKRRTKAEMEAARAADAAQAEPVEAEPVEAEPVEAEPVKAEPVKAEPVKAPAPFDYALLKANVIKLATGFGTDGRAAAVKLLADYGVAKADQVPAAKWAELNAKVEAAIASFTPPAEEPEDDDFA